MSLLRSSRRRPTAPRRRAGADRPPRRSRRGAVVLFVAALGWLPATALWAQPGAAPAATASAGDDGLYVIVEASQRPLDGLLVLPVACGPHKAWCDTFEAVVHNDMRLSGVVRALAPPAAQRKAILRYSVPNLEVDLAAARRADVVWALGMWIRKSKGASDAIEVHLQLIDARDGHQVEFGRYAQLTGPAHSIRKLAHRVSNVVFGALTGTMGSFDGQVFYSAPAVGVDRGIWIADADGYDARLVVGDKGVHMLPRPTADRGLCYVSFRTDLPSLFRIDGPALDAQLPQWPSAVTPASAHHSPWPVGADATATPSPPKARQPKGKGKGKTAAPPAVGGAAAASASGPLLPWASSDELQFRTATVAVDGRVVATINDGDQADLWLLDERGRPLRNLTHHESDDLDPSWSPDGSHLAFVSNRSGNPQIYMMKADGSDVQRLTWAGAYNTGPDWGPDGKIVYSGLRGSAVDILTVDAKRQVQRLTPGRGRRSLEPTWAPCGKRVVYVSDEDGAGARLWFTSADGAVREPLALPAGRYYTPAWRRAPGAMPEAFRP